MTVQVVNGEDVYEFEGINLTWAVSDGSVGSLGGLLTISEDGKRVATFRNWDNVSRVQEDESKKTNYTVNDGVIDAAKIFEGLRKLNDKVNKLV